MRLILQRFAKTKKDNNGKIQYADELKQVYATAARMSEIVRNLNSVLESQERFDEIWRRYWRPVALLFSAQRDDKTEKKTLDEVVSLVGSEEHRGNFVILDMSEKGGRELSESLQAMFVKMIQSRLVDIGEKFYTDNKKVNCLVVMDEAHRFISDTSSDGQIRELTTEIIDAVRTTRKYGIGYMFITQTIESLNEEILRQMRIFAFGYGLTTGSEFRKVGEIVNSKEAEKLYRSFIDPSSNGRFPFMVYGPISPLSFTGSPLFLEVYTNFNDFQ
ncbi:ATP-binding protein [Candidatus Saccharibacteria bacterium]|nr:ATP-binding protein [Candidatus Saccharibacteria bacterium]